MSTMAISQSAIIHLGRALLSIACCQHKTVAWMETNASAHLLVATHRAWAKYNGHPTKNELITRVMDTLWLFNQRAVQVRYAHHGEFYSPQRIRLIASVGQPDLMSQADYIQAYKNAQALENNLDHYNGCQPIADMINVIKNVLINQIICSTDDYKKAKWGDK